MSAGSPSRRIRVAFSIGVRRASLVATISSAEVRIEPGAMALTRIFGAQVEARSVGCGGRARQLLCCTRRKPRAATAHGGADVDDVAAAGVRQHERNRRERQRMAVKTLNVNASFMSFTLVPAQAVRWAWFRRRC